jgi:hypothetical protein
MKSSVKMGYTHIVFRDNLKFHKKKERDSLYFPKKTLLLLLVDIHYLADNSFYF